MENCDGLLVALPSVCVEFVFIFFRLYIVCVFCRGLWLCERERGGIQEFGK